MRRKFIWLFGCVLIITLLLTTYGGQPRSQHKDLDLLIRTVTAVHPLGRSGLPQKFIDTIRWAEEEMKKNLSHSETVSVLTQALVSLGDAHTFFHYDIAAGQAIELPLLWLEDGLYIGRTTSLLQQGDRILSISGQSPQTLLERLRLYVPAENIYWVRVRGEEALQRETMLRGLALVNPDDTVTIEYMSVLSHEPRTVRLPLHPYNNNAKQARNPDRPPMGWYIDEGYSLGYFYFDKCTLDETYKRQLAQFFSAVKDKEIKNIAVDLRHNGGGNSLTTNEFLKYIDIDRYRTYSHVLRLKGLMNIPIDLGLVNRKNRTYSDLAFSGKVFVLTSPQTFSAANWFATVFHDNDLATLVGEPIGNSPSAYGNILKTYTLPDSELSFSVSMSHFVRPDPSLDPKDSLYPHVHVPTTMEDILAGRDPQLEAVKDIVSGKR